MSDPLLASPPARSDSELLEHFVAEGSDESFRRIVERHGRWVLGICRQNLSDMQLAEDAFQATWLVLIRNAGKIKSSDALASWLFGVATRICTRTRCREARRSIPHEVSVTVSEDPLRKLLAQHERDVTCEELSALPESLRQPMVLRYLAGRTNREVADEMNLTVAAVEGRLKRAKRLLQGRLVRRGVTLSVAIHVLSSTSSAVTAVPAALVESTTQIWTASASSVAHAYGDSIHSMALEESLTMGTTVSLKPLAAFLIAGCVTAAGLGVPAAWSSQGERQDDRDPFTLETAAGSAAAEDSDAQTAVAVAIGTSSEAPKAAELPYPRVMDLKPRTTTEQRIAAALASDVDVDFVDTPLRADPKTSFSYRIPRPWETFIEVLG